MAAAKGKRKRKEDEEGGIAYILKAFNGFQAYFSSPAPTPSPNVSKKLDLLKLNDYVYELCKPSGRPSVEIVFFHGFQLGGSRQTYATTWLSRNGSELWPNWIRKSVPEVRILLVSYDGSARKKDDRGRTDMYVTSENLVQSLTGNAAQVGQDGCPVILVGHSLGGLVIKEILLQANKVLSLDKPENPNLRVQSFLENVKQLFYYSCPHNGTRLADDKTVPQKGQLFKLLRTLNKKAARRNEEFRKLRDKFKWGAYSIAEKLPADLGSLGKQVVVEEASARHDTEGYYTADADHFSVCQPASDIDSSFSTLRDIIDCTSREVVRGHQIETPTTLVGLNDQIFQVTMRLRRTRYLSICGIGGIGKSTLAMAVYNAISGNFEYTSFVSEVKKKLVGKQVSTENFQEEILKNLYYKGNKSEHGWDRLKGKRVLIILDDVEYESQVFVMPETDRGVRFFSDHSRVLVTCRNKSIVSSKDFAVHDAQFLGKEASRKLFCCHAFKEDHAPGPYKDHVGKFIAKCGGLPLALEVAGKYLYKKEDEAMWNGAFQRLSAAKPLGGSKTDALWSIFEVIYEDLQEEEQQMFLDIATCFHGDKKETANLVWRCCDWVTTADVGWQNLVDIGFVRLGLTDGSNTHIWMHELLRDFGWKKANPESIESYSRVCYRRLSWDEDNGKAPPWPFKEGTTPLVKLLRIAVDDLPIDTERLRGLENLKVLLLERVTVYGAFNLLPDNLEVLIMRECEWTVRSSKSVSDPVDHYDIPRDGWCSTLGESSAPKPGQHVSLRHVEFHRCHHFVPEQGLFSDALFPDHSFEHLPALKYLRLHIPEYYNLTCLPDSLGQLQSLRELKVDCETLTRLPDSLGQLQSLQKLDVKCKTLTRLPDSLGQLQSLRELKVDCETLTRLPDSLGQLQSLQKLDVKCKTLTRLPDSLGQLQSLRELKVDCETLTRLPDSLGQLQSLQKLDVKCKTLTRLPDSLGQLGDLQELRISGTPLTALPDNLGQLGDLQELRISGTPLTALPDNLGQLGRLVLLEIYGCCWLTALPDTLGQLDGLRELKIEWCRSLTALPDNLGQLDGLRELKIKECRSLTALPDNLGQLGGLQELKIEWCSSLTALPDNFGQLDGLRKLKIEDCDGLTSLPDTLGQLGGLRELKIKDCCGLTALPDNLGQLGCLRELEIEDCFRLTSLPDTLGQLGGLQELKIKGCRSLTALPDNFGQLDGLRKLKIEDCDGLTSLPDTLGQLGGLRELKIKECCGLTALPDNLGQLGCLRELEIEWCGGLTALPDNLGHLGGLQRLVIHRCRSLETLPDALGDLHALQYLKVTDCWKLEALPDTVTKLHCVKIFKKL